MTAAAAIAPGTLYADQRDPHPDDGHIIAQRRRAGRVRDLPEDDHRRRGLPYLTTVPDCEPPFDDECVRPGQDAVGARSAERAPDRRGVRPAVASAGVQVAPLPPIRRSRRGATSLRGPAATATTAVTATAATLLHSPGMPDWSDDADAGPRMTATANLPAAERSASMLARALIEVLSGHRDVSQLRVHCAPDVYAALADRPRFASAALPHLVSVRVCEPADGVAEVSVVYRRAERVRALAFRMQGVDGSWRMTALQLC